MRNLAIEVWALFWPALAFAAAFAARVAIPARSVHVNGATTTATTARSDASPGNALDGGIGAGRRNGSEPGR